MSLLDIIDFVRSKISLNSVSKINKPLHILVILKDKLGGKCVS